MVVRDGARRVGGDPAAVLRPEYRLGVARDHSPGGRLPRALRRAAGQPRRTGGGAQRARAALLRQIAMRGPAKAVGRAVDPHPARRGGAGGRALAARGGIPLLHRAPGHRAGPVDGAARELPARLSSRGAAALMLAAAGRRFSGPPALAVRVFPAKSYLVLGRQYHQYRAASNKRRRSAPAGRHARVDPDPDDHPGYGSLPCPPARQI